MIRHKKYNDNIETDNEINIEDVKSDDVSHQDIAGDKEEIIDTEEENGDTKDENTKKNKLKNRKKIPLKKRLIGFSSELIKIVLILAVCAGIGAFIAVGQRKSSPYRCAEKYFTSYITNNYKQMYKLVDCDESDFINYDAFAIKCEGEKIYGSIKDYKIGSAVKSKNKITYVVTYRLTDDEKDRTLTITLKKQKSNIYLFFDNWIVSVDRTFVDNYSLQAPTGANVQLDGKDISKYKKGTTEDGNMDIYTVDRIFTGDHTVTVNLGTYGDINKTQYVSSKDDEIIVTTDEFALKPDVKQTMYDYATTVVKSMYEYAMDKSKPFADVSNLYAADEVSQASAKATYDAISTAIQKDNGASLRVIDIQSLSPSIKSFTYPDSVTIQVDYTYTFSAVSGTSLISGIIENYDGSGTATAYINLNLVNNVWKITSADLSCIDYSKQS